MKRLICLLFVFSLTGCLWHDQTQFWHRRDLAFRFEPVPAYQGRTIHRIGVYWQQGNGPADSLEPSKVIWEAVAVRPVAIGGFSFELFKVPRGFRLAADNRGSAVEGGVYFVKGVGMSEGSEQIVLHAPISYRKIAE